MLTLSSRLKTVSNLGKLDENISFVLSYTCQDKINQEIDHQSDEWLRLHSVLQNVKGKDISTMTAILENKKPIVVTVLYNIMMKRYTSINFKIS